MLMLSRKIPQLKKLGRSGSVIQGNGGVHRLANHSTVSIESPTTTVRKAHVFDEQVLITYLQQHEIVQSKKVSVRQFSHGQSNPTFLITDENGLKLVLRKQPPGALLKGAHAVDREYRVMTALKDTNVPVPKTRLLCTDKSVIGTPFFCYDFMEGNFFSAPKLDKVNSAAERHTMYASMIDTMARIHAVDIDKSGLSDFGARRLNQVPDMTEKGDIAMPIPYVLRQVKTWAKQYRATETETIEDMNRLIDELPELLPPGAEMQSCLTHGDYRIDNMIFLSTDSSVGAVLDWELSTLGDRYADVAYNCMTYHLDPNNPFLKGIRDLDLKALGIPSQTEALALYQESFSRYAPSLSGDLNSSSLSNLNYYSAFSFFRACAILQGVYKRALDGNASAENASVALKYARETARIGYGLLKEYKSTFGKGAGAGGGFSLRHYSTSAKFSAVSSMSSSVQLDTPLVNITYPLLSKDLVSKPAVNTLQRVVEFFNERIIPAEHLITKAASEPKIPGDEWKIHPRLEELKEEAKAAGLWNFFLPLDTDKGKYGAGLTNLEYATIAELTGRSFIAPEVFNCSAPDTGNMEVLARYGSEQQKRDWLDPLLNGNIRSCFAMTEPDVASSDATNMEALIDERDDELVLTGKKWWISGALDPRCKICVFMGRRSNASAYPAHLRHSMVLVPMDTPGLEIIRTMRVMGFDDAPHGHAELLFDNVRVPSTNVILQNGAGFEVAQGRLGPGRIHHCMRLIGMAERALELMCIRATSRKPFGKYLAEQGSVLEDIAKSRVEIDSTRLLCLNAARSMDLFGNKASLSQIASIKIMAPLMAKTIVDRAIQVHGGMGLSQDTPLAKFWSWARVLQLADGPDQVHMAQLGKNEIAKHSPDFKRKITKKTLTCH